VEMRKMGLEFVNGDHGFAGWERGKYIGRPTPQIRGVMVLWDVCITQRFGIS
jgi:hypothetical protein